MKSICRCNPAADDNSIEDTSSTQIVHSNEASDSRPTSRNSTVEVSNTFFEVSLSSLTECPVCQVPFEEKFRNSFRVGYHLASHFSDELNLKLGLNEKERHTDKVKCVN
jgi:hypothetical protein